MDRKNQALQKLHSGSGVNRLVFLLVLAVLAMAAAAGLPLLRADLAQAAEYGCAVAINKAQDMIDENFLLASFSDLDNAEIRAVVDRSKLGRDQVCPAGGDYYVVQQSGRFPEAVIVCGIHDSDLRQRTRLNAENLLRLLGEALEDFRTVNSGSPDPEGLAVTLNGEETDAAAVEELPGIRRGTGATPGYAGTVACYVADRQGISRFLYADEAYCAYWVRGVGWSGDSWEETG